MDLLPAIIKRLEGIESNIYNISIRFENNDFVSQIIDEMEIDILEIKDDISESKGEDGEELEQLLEDADILIDNLSYTLKVLKMTLDEGIEPQSLSQWKRNLIEESLYSKMAEYSFNYMHSLLHGAMSPNDDTVPEQTDFKIKSISLPLEEQIQLEKINAPNKNIPLPPGLKAHFKPEIAEASFTKDIIKISDSLDKLGLHKEADLLDALIKKLQKRI